MCRPEDEQATKTTSDSTGSTSTSNSSILTNKKWILIDHPHGHFDAKRDAKLVEEEEIDLESSSTMTISLEADQVMVKVEALSVDAFVRTMLDPSDAYHGNSGPGMTLPAVGYGTVVKVGSASSSSEAAASMPVGTRVTGLLGACTVCVKKTTELFKVVSFPYVPKSLSLGYLGTSGLTAYTGMFLALPNGGHPKKGETVVVSAAAGAVGSIAAQMAKCCGARVIGVAGGAKKTQFLLDKLNLDGAIDYKDTTTRTLEDQVKEQCPNGIDFYFDNVGGELLDLILDNINTFARIVVCGAISQYGNGNINTKGSVQGPSNYIKLAEKSSTMTGFNFMHHTSKIYKAVPYLLWHYYRGNIKVHEQVEEGLESFPLALEKLFNGGHCGRLLVDVDGTLRSN